MTEGEKGEKGMVEIKENNWKRRFQRKALTTTDNLDSK